MSNEYYAKICEGRDVRSNLIALRDQIRKDEKSKRAFAYELGGSFEKLTVLLKEQDPKIRRNAALILGEMETEDVLPFLFDAYEEEAQLFVRPAYLKAMAHLDCEDYVERLERRLAVLEQTQATEENRKHLYEEMTALRGLLKRYEKASRHRYIGYKPAPEVILVTNRLQKEVTASQITEGEVTMLAAGVRVKGGDLEEITQIRTVTEMLFPIPGSRFLSADPAEAGRQLAAMQIPEFLDDLHEGTGAYRYRIDLKSKLELSKKGIFIRHISAELDTASAGRLYNSPDSYEIEIRLIERKDGTFLPLLKLFTLRDGRFVYRKETVGTSIAPVNAALTARLAMPWLKEGAQVLDPFCGVGTMLLERNYCVKAGTMYGIDLFGEAIEKARDNTDHAGVRANYINRDFFDFTHEYLFDEIITDLPRVGKNMSEHQLDNLIRRFFGKAQLHLTKEGVVILYTDRGATVRSCAGGSSAWKIEAEFPLNEKTGTGVYVLKQRF